MLSTSTDVQLHSAINTASIGLGPCVSGVRVKTIVLPLSVFPFESLVVFPFSMRDHLL